MATDSSSQLPGLPGFDPENIQPWTIAVVVSVTVLALASVGLRLTSRRIRRQPLWWDDYMIIFSMVWNLAVVAFIFAMHSNGMGIHADKVPMDNIVMMAIWLVVAEILYAWNLVWTKISLLLMYSRIFPTKTVRRASIGIGSFVVAWGVTIMFLFIFICVPVEKLWYPSLPGRCIDQVATWIANAISTILTDLAILLMPLPQVWRLQLRKSEKIGLTAAFSLGFFVVFASAYRTSVLFTYSNSDPTYTLAPTVGWTAIEMSAGIVSACLPTMQPALSYLARLCGVKTNIFGFSSKTDGHGKDSYNLGSATGPQQTIGGSRMHSHHHHNHAQMSHLTQSSREELVDGSAASTKEGGNSTSSRRYKRCNSSDGGGNGGRTRVLQSPRDAALRPDVHGVKYKVSSYPSRDEDTSVDEVPINSILVQQDFTHESSLDLDQNSQQR